MKKYFAKYLPAEGGSLIIKNIGGKEERIIGKLFLCSRDIQVGDKMWSSISGSLKEYTRTLQMDFDIAPPSYTGDPDLGSFKVIAPISPQALWVKEGDEFDEDELSIWDDSGSYCDAESWIPFITIEKEAWIDLGENLIVGIKCPTCKIFH